jgi:DNA-binding protein YbaB
MRARNIGFLVERLVAYGCILRPRFANSLETCILATFTYVMFGPELIQQLSKLKGATDSGMQNLPNYLLDGSAGNGLIRLKLDGNYVLKELHLAADMKQMEIADLEDFLALALNDAIVKVTKLREEELTRSLTNLIQNP